MAVSAQTADSLMAAHLRSKGVKLYDGNSVQLLKTGHDKFEDMFEAVRNAKSFIHLEYFNFRNDSIAGLLFHLLAQKAAEGVEVRALYDAFGNSSNSGVATHLCKTTEIRSKKENRGSHIGRGHGGFAAGVTSAYNYNVKTVVHTLSRRPR